PFGALVIVGAANAVNLTDGLDGLAIGPVMIAGGTFAVFAYTAGHAKIAEYLQIPFVPGAGELAVFCGALAAAGLGFLWFNAYPAQMFMGDVGSLALGAALGVVALITRQELVLVLVGGVFVRATDRRGAAELGIAADAWTGVELRLGEEGLDLLSGVDLVVPSPGIARDVPLLATALRRGIPVRSEIEVAAGLLRCPVVAITGTNGKSTTTSLAGLALVRTGRRTFVGGNLGTPLITAVGTDAEVAV